MPMDFAVLGGDARQGYLADYLQKEGHAVFGHTDPWEKAEIVILPLPALDKAGRIRGTMLYPQNIAGRLSPDALVLGGKTEAFSHLFPRCEDYALWESLALENALPTAEGAIQIAMEHMSATIAHSRFLVVGAGRIGMVLAQKLQALGASVTLTARKDADFDRIFHLGLDSDMTGEYLKGLNYDCVLNTVPSPVFTREQISQTPKHCLFIELASAPYGIAAQDCEAVKRQFVLGAALPGRVAPKTAGEILARQILAFLRSTD